MSELLLYNRISAFTAESRLKERLQILKRGELYRVSLSVISEIRKRVKEEVKDLETSLRLAGGETN